MSRGGFNRSNTIEFIKKSKEKFKDLFDYSETDYKDRNTNVKLKCNICKKIILVLPSVHLRSKGCRYCNNRFKMNNESFIEKAKQIHGDKYDYSLINYINNYTKVKIICKKHGVFEQKPNAHLSQKQGCPKCSNHYSFVKNEFVEKAKQIHGDKYDYSLINGIDFRQKAKVKIKCNKCNNIFETNIGNHIHNKSGCPKCKYEKISKILKIKKVKPFKNFLKRAKQVHGDKYNYSLMKNEYKGLSYYYKIICPFHGEFIQRANDHACGSGCPICKQSHGEMKIEQYLIKNNIDYIKQKKFNDCKNIKPLSFDFYLPNYNTCIEYQGEQHYMPVKRFGGEFRFNNVIRNDKIKEEFCKKNNINLIKISYKDFKNINNIMEECFLRRNNVN